jgi:CHAT domain-containing protein
MRLDAFTEETRSFFAQEPGYFYTFMVQACLQLGYAREAFEYVEASKSRILLDQLATDPAFQPRLATEGDPLIEHEQELLQEVRLVERSLRQAATGSNIRELRIRLESLLDSLHAVWEALMKEHPGYILLRRGVSISYNDLLSFLEQDTAATALVEYYDLFESIHAFVIRPGQKDPMVIDTGLKRSDLNQSIRRYLEQVVQRTRFDQQPFWLELSSSLFGKVSEQLDEIEKIYIIPHGFLHLLPFHVIRVGDHHLVDRFTLITSPSATILDRIHRRHGSRQLRHTHPKALVLGNPTGDLAHAGREAQEVAAILETQPYLGMRATLDMVLQEAGDKDIVHIACHGYFDPEHPMNSGIVLSNHEPLTARDILNLQLQSELVTLSACLTGLHKIESGDELTGLARAFLYAGTDSLLVSLWPVHDETTAHFMKAFYQQWIDPDSAKTKAETVRQVMLTIRAQKPEPFYWAPFILIGHE